MRSGFGEPGGVVQLMIMISGQLQPEPGLGAQVIIFSRIKRKWRHLTFDVGITCRRMLDGKSNGSSQWSLSRSVWPGETTAPRVHELQYFWDLWDVWFSRKISLSQLKESVTVLITESLKYVKNQCVSAEEVAFKDSFTCDCLKSWYDLKRNKALAIGYVWHSRRVFRRKIWFKSKTRLCQNYNSNNDNNKCYLARVISSA